MAAAGRYLSPVAFGPCVDGLPLLVLHFWAVHAFRLFCGAFNLYTPHQTFCTVERAFVLFSRTIGLERPPSHQP